MSSFNRGKSWLALETRALADIAAAAVLKRVRRRTFMFDGQRVTYFTHPYNTTWKNERAVEVPLALRALERHRGGRVLEVGNVLRHYFTFNHDVVDKYEQGEGVRNLDVLEFQPAEEFDLIVAISTLEHVGFDEEDQSVEKPRRVVEHLAGYLRPGGELFVTIPLGYNPQLDDQLRSRLVAFDELSYLMRVSADNRWEQVDASAVEGAKYDEPYEKANALAVGVSRRRA